MRERPAARRNISEARAKRWRSRSPEVALVLGVAAFVPPFLMFFLSALFKSDLLGASWFVRALLFVVTPSAGIASLLVFIRSGREARRTPNARTGAILSAGSLLLAGIGYLSWRITPA